MKLTNLCFLIRDLPSQILQNKTWEGEEVLLAMKKRGFGAGKWNGVGGKVSAGESMREATIREAEEEITVKILDRDLEQKAVLNFSFDGKPEWNQECHVFVARKWQCEPVETEEMKPEWFNTAKIPFEKMWVDDALWLPKVLAGESLKAEFVFDREGKIIKSYKIIKAEF